jgi:hypothetical protein
MRRHVHGWERQDLVDLDIWKQFEEVFSSVQRNSKVRQNDCRSLHIRVDSFRSRARVSELAGLRWNDIGTNSITIDERFCHGDWGA